jgi:hypothetical protein
VGRSRSRTLCAGTDRREVAMTIEVRKVEAVKATSDNG